MQLISAGQKVPPEKTELTKLMEMRNYGNTELWKCRVKGNALKNKCVEKTLAFCRRLLYTLNVKREFNALPQWRNGRRSRLKICRGQLRAGSSPACGIREKQL